MSIPLPDGVTDAELRQLLRDTYDGDTSQNVSADLARLALGEPLAYVIGWVPYLGLRISLASKPLIPRPETEWWTEELIIHLKTRFEDQPFSLLDLCAGSGCIGLAVLAAFPNAFVSFGELSDDHTSLIRKNLRENGLDENRATVRTSDLFDAFKDERFNVIVSNPPYIPEGRVLESSVTEFEPADALYSGDDGLTIIRRIAKDAPRRLAPSGELWMECDIANIEEAATLLTDGGAERTLIRTDQYSRPRVCVGYYA